MAKTYKLKQFMVIKKKRKEINNNYANKAKKPISS